MEPGAHPHPSRRRGHSDVEQKKRDILARHVHDMRKQRDEQRKRQSGIGERVKELFGKGTAKRQANYLQEGTQQFLGEGKKQLEQDEGARLRALQKQLRSLFPRPRVGQEFDPNAVPRMRLTPEMQLGIEWSATNSDSFAHILPVLNELMALNAKHPQTNPEFIQFYTQIMTEQANGLEQKFDHVGTTETEYHTAVLLTLQHGTSEQKMVMRPLCEEYVSQAVMGEYNERLLIDSIAQLIEHGTDEQNSSMFTIVQKMIQEQQPSMTILHQVWAALHTKETQKKQEDQTHTDTALFNLIIQEFQLNPEEMHLAWTESNMEKPDNGILKNFGKLLALESQKKGAAKVLHDEFGIQNFGRYPAALLMDQYEQRDNYDLPYGIIMNARSDHNGAFSKNEYIYNGIDNALKGNYRIRVIEVGNAVELFQHVKALNDRYGEQHKISFALIGAHGQTDTMEFEVKQKTVPKRMPWYTATFSSLFGLDTTETKVVRRRIQSSHIRNKRIEQMKSFFVEHPFFILNSCSTGAPGGIAQVLSESFEATVCAPQEPAGLSSVSVQGVESALQFYVENTSQDESSQDVLAHRVVQTRYYMNGQDCTEQFQFQQKQKKFAA